MGRRFGKTRMMQELIVSYRGGALAGDTGDGKQGGLPCAWYAPNDAYFSKVYQWISSVYAPVVRRSASSPRPFISFINGGSIDFWTLENPMRCGRGNAYARVVIDEAAHARHLQDAWEQTIEYTLADMDGDAWFISTPYGMNFFSELFRRAENDPDWVSHTAPSHDNPFLPKGWMEEKRKTSPERIYRQEVLAEFLDTGAGVFRGVDLLPACPWEDSASSKHTYVIGVDWARTNDFTAFVVARNDGNIVHIDHFSGIGYELQVGRLKNLYHRFGMCPVLAEANSMGGPLIERLQREGMRIKPFWTTAASKAEAVESLSLAVENARISIPEDQRMDTLKKELIAFDQERTASGIIRYGAPPGMHDDTVIALAIAWSGIPIGKSIPQIGAIQREFA